MKTVKLTGNEVRALMTACNSSQINGLPGVEWSFIVTLVGCDMKLLAFGKAMNAAGEMKNIGDGEEPDVQKKLAADYKEFDEKRVALCEKHAIKDPDGTAVTRLLPGMAQPKYIFEDEAKFEAAFEKLKKKFNSAVEAREAQTELVKAKLEAEEEYKLPEVKMADVPKGITPILLRPFAKLLVSGE